MAFPVLLKKLFKNEGAGPELREDIIPQISASKLPDDYLSKSGGDVKGAVTIEHGYRGLVQKLPSTATYTDHAFLDKNGDIYANIRVTKNTDGASNVGISANGKDASGATTWNTLEVGANADGSSPYVRFKGTNVVRSVNNNYADINGNVSVDISLTKDKVVNALGYTPPTTNTTYSSGTGISIGTDNAINLATVVTAGNGGPTADASPGFGGTFTVPYFTYDAYGRITARTNRTITLPAKPATELPNVGTKTYTTSSTNTTTYFTGAVKSFSLVRDAYGRVSSCTLNIYKNTNCVCDAN